MSSEGQRVMKAIYECKQSAQVWMGVVAAKGMHGGWWRDAVACRARGGDGSGGGGGVEEVAVREWWRGESEHRKPNTGKISWEVKHKKRRAEKRERKGTKRGRRKGDGRRVEEGVGGGQKTWLTLNPTVTQAKD